MRYAIFSDIHGNLPAWHKVLEDIRSLEADVLICLGDVVGYGPKPQEVLDAIRAVTPHFVLGNHDAAAAGLLDPSIFNDKAHAIVLWTRENLNPESMEFIKNTPLELSTEDLLFVHAEVSQPGRFDYIEEATQAAANFAARDHFVTFVGHTHHPLIFEQAPTGVVNTYADLDRHLDPDCRYIINVGSVGEPRNPDDIRARYLLYDDDTKQVFFRRVDFDPDAYRQDLASSSLTHKPYFLQVLDHHANPEAAQAHDMQVPAEAVINTNTAQRGLVFPTQASVAAKPKPLPLASSKKSSIAPILIGGTALLLCLGAAFWLIKNRSVAPAETLADAQTTSSHTPPRQTASAETPVEKEAPPEDITPSPGGLVTDSGLAQQKLLYAINDNEFDFADQYTSDNSAKISSDSFDRVGYFVELDKDWVWVSMDRFQSDPKLLGVPQANSGIVENGTLVKNLRIESNRADLNALNRPNLSGIIEFWSSDFMPNGQGEHGSNDLHLDWKDSGGSTKPGYGSFQIFAFNDERHREATTLFGITKSGGSGIGNQEPYKPAPNLSWQSTDWTFVPKTHGHQKRNLEIWVGSSK